MLNTDAERLRVPRVQRQLLRRTIKQFPKVLHHLDFWASRNAQSVSPGKGPQKKCILSYILLEDFAVQRAICQPTHERMMAAGRSQVPVFFPEDFVQWLDFDGHGVWRYSRELS
jgi:hypothetical protein